jgi:hypothetical protein
LHQILQSPQAVTVTHRHPTDKTLVWRAKGQKPKWLRELEADGERPIEFLVEDRKAG